MASNHDLDEKPNLRPTKHVAAGGKTIFLHHNPNQPSTKSYIHATWKNSDENASDKADPFGIEQPSVQYSLNKQQRWEVLDDFRRRLANQGSSSSDDELDVQSDSEQPRRTHVQRKKKSARRKADASETKYRLYEFQGNPRQANCVGITSNVGQQRVQAPRKTYMRSPAVTARTGLPEEIQPNNANGDGGRQRTTADVTYYTVVPLPQEKHLANIRKQTTSKAKKLTSGVQRSKFTEVKERLDVAKQLEDSEEQTSTDEDEPISPSHPSAKPGSLQLNDFIPVVPNDEALPIQKITENLVTVDKFDPKSSRFYLDDIDPSRQFRRQMSREEKLYQRDKAVYLQRQKSSGKKIEPIQKPLHHLMALAFRSILVNKTDLTVEHLSQTYGKNFIHAQCYPTKYLIGLTDRLKSCRWSSDFELFPTYATLNAYLVLLVDDESSTNENFSRVQVGLNMDLFANSVELETLYESAESIYRVDAVIEKAVEFVTTLPLDTFKPIDSELNRRKLIQNEEESQMSESEFINKQIRHLQVLNKSQTQTKAILEDEHLNNDESMEDYELIKPTICTSCCQDIDESTPMTGLKACAHWLCNDCWKQYLENAVKGIKVVLCPEWNCCSIVDFGTMLSLVNIRCMNVYERNIEKCLVNLSRSHVKCPSKSCSNIVQVIGSGFDYVRCRCSHEFCLSCKREPHFPATCNSYRLYIDEVYRNGDFISDYNAITQIKGRNCISCNNFIEKNGGCNHMTCRCGAEFCWTCTGYWNDHNAPDGTFRCPKEALPLQEEVLAKHHNQSRRYYYNAIFHHHERVLLNQPKQYENAKRLLGTIPLEKGTLLDSSLIQSQIDKRQSMLRHLNEMVKYISYLHRVCEFIAVSADGYGNNPSEFRNSLQPLETIVFSMSQILEGGRGYKAIEQLTQLHASSEKSIDRLRRAVTLRELRRKNTTGYVTS